MSVRTIFEFNHDYTWKIEHDPAKFAIDLVRYLNSGSDEDCERLERYGIRRAWWGHHTTERKVVTKHSETEL